MASVKKYAGCLAALATMVLGVQAASADGLRDRSGPATSSAPQSIVVFSGADGVRDSNYLFQGAVVALNGDIGRDGFLFRAYGASLNYNYDGPAGRTDGVGWQGDAMIGYKAGRGPIWAAAYVGVDYQNQKLNPPDPTNSVQGTEWGFKVVADVASLRTEGPLYFSLSGSYSTAFQTYWSRARVGANFPRVTIGPEYIALGNKGFDAQRVGGFMTFDVPITRTLPLEVTLYAGYQFVAGSNNNDGGTTGGTFGGEGTYYGISLVSLF